MSRGRILFVDDEERLRASAAEWLTLSGFAVETAAGASEAEECAARAAHDCVVTDLRMPGVNGIELLQSLHGRDPELPVVLLTGHGDVQAAVEAMRLGAHDFLEKPYDADHLVVVLDRAVRARRMAVELRRLSGSDRAALENRLVGLSPAMTSLRERLLQIAQVDVDVLILGETGTGKEVVARALHDFSARRASPFVAVNCAAVPESVFESEMFGHARGAFTGAVAARAGKFEHAQGGTIFLDEIESMPLALQAKVLRVLQERVVEPLGTNRQVPIDVRVVAASKVDLKAEGEAGRFRADLYFRLAAVELSLPPLRQRCEDVPLLFRLFVEEAASRFGLPPRPASRALLDHLAAGEWPGNVRELKAHATRFALALDDRGGGAGSDETGLSLPEAVQRFEAGRIVAALEAAGWVTSRAAEDLGIPRRTLAEKIARYGIKRTAVQS